MIEQRVVELIKEGWTQRDIAVFLGVYTDKVSKIRNAHGLPQNRYRNVNEGRHIFAEREMLACRRVDQFLEAVA